MAKKTLESLVDEKDSFIEGAENDLTDGFAPIENSIYNAVMKEIYKMDQEDGKILFNDANLLILLGLADLIVSSIQKSSYPTKVKDYIGSFPRVRQYNLKIQNSVNGNSISEMDELIIPLENEIARQVTDGLTGQGIYTQFITPLTETIYKNLVAGTTIEQLKSSLLTLIESNPDRLGIFKRYVTQISRDAIMQYEGQINARIADYYGYNAYRYVGSIIRDSRPQCIRWLGKGILMKSELEGEIAWAYNSGAGMIPGTGADNFSVYRGGYNCRHTAVPVMITK